MKEKFERFKNEKIVINVRSPKQYDDFMKMCEEQGLKWSGGNLPTKQYYYNFYKEETCINLNNLKELSYCDIDFYKNYGYKIITYKDFMKKSNQFTKSDLKDNHIVVNKKGNKQVWGNKDKSLFNNDLTSKTNDKKTIVEVYEFDKLVWKREEQILDEVEKKYLGDVVRPFRDRVRNIVKIDGVVGIYISIRIKGEASIDLPYLKNKNMYKGMEVDKEYTLKELGLGE